MKLPPKEGVGNAGCPLHPRPRVHLVVVERRAAIRPTRWRTMTTESVACSYSIFEKAKVDRHCERSEAIHLAAQRKNGLLRCARNDG